MKLLPCPFCGKNAAVVWTSEEAFGEELFDYSNDITYAVTCDASNPNGLGGCGGSSGFKATKELAIVAWNTRSEK